MDGAPEAGDDEEGVIDAQGEGEHDGEVERPDRKLGEAGDAVEDAHRGDQPGGGEQEGKASSSERAEGEDEDEERHRPGEHLGFHHAFAIDGVEIGPEGRGSGEGNVDGAVAQGGDVVGDALGGTDGLGGLNTGASLEHDGSPVRAGLRGKGGGEGRLGGEHRLGSGDLRGERRVVGGGAIGPDDDDGRLGGIASELALDDLACGEGVRACNLPHGAGERVLEPRSEGPERAREDDPGEDDRQAVGSDPAAEAAERAGTPDQRFMTM